MAAIRYVRFRDLVVAQEHQKEIDPTASGLELAEAHLAGLFELPQFTHDMKQFIARVDLIATAMPELEFPAFDGSAMRRALGRAFAGLTLAKEAQAAGLKGALQGHLAPEQVAWLDELAPAQRSLLHATVARRFYQHPRVARVHRQPQHLSSDRRQVARSIWIRSNRTQ